MGLTLSQGLPKLRQSPFDSRQIFPNALPTLLTGRYFLPPTLLRPSQEGCQFFGHALRYALQSVRLRLHGAATGLVVQSSQERYSFLQPILQLSDFGVQGLQLSGQLASAILATGKLLFQCRWIDGTVPVQVLPQLGGTLLQRCDLIANLVDFLAERIARHGSSSPKLPQV